MISIPIKKATATGAVLFAAALALPFQNSAFAEAAPERSIIAFKYLNYQDYQPDKDRIGVNAFTVMGMVPIAGQWSISTTYTNDSVSGASPHHHSSVSGASKIKEHRQAVDLGLTRYFHRGSITVGGSYSSENDYVSRSYSAQGSIMTEDKNTTFTLGGSYTTDTISPSNDKPNSYDKKGVAALAGVTQVLTKNDIVQLNLGYSNGWGYFSDPYKLYDERPDNRNTRTIMARWNHHFDGSDGTGRISYRYYTDSFGIDAHTIGLEYVQPLSNGWTVTPSARYHSQTAAYFYQPDMPPPGPPPIPPISLDQRLSAFGALTLGIKVEKQVAKDWLFDVKYDYYQQRPEWCLTGKGDKGLDPFFFRSIQVGVSKKI
ncbi:MAG: DUF3570 domain-containing protein [Chlorobiaceae bacterium]|jgi:hypothetical protein|nr:DUF3570 domain-containing protein [Chlorobiaceae bacterium]